MDRRDFKRGLKALWADTIQGKKPSLEGAPLRNPYRKGDPLSEALAHLILKKGRRASPPIDTQTVAMPVAELCQLVLLWASAQEREAASSLAHALPLDFPWLWCKESEYREEEALASVALLRRALGREEEWSGSGDPYFETLAQTLCKLPPPGEGPRPLDWFEVEAEGLKCAFTFAGDHTSLGSALSEFAEIRAFGPQVFPLSAPEGFGLRKTRGHGNRWASFAARPEVWFEAEARPKGAGIAIDLSFFGVKPGGPLAFSFYAKTESAQVGNEKIQPRTLQRYHGATKPIRFGEGFLLQSLIPGKMELIPLAGSGGFWDCEYLAAFEIHPVGAKLSFSLQIEAAS